MTVNQVGLVDTTGALDPELVRAAAAAINVQVTRDLPQFWHSHATVIYLPNAKKVPSGVWPVKLVDKLPPVRAASTSTSTTSPTRRSWRLRAAKAGPSPPATKFSRCS
jgi:hypothetical protein